MIQLVYRCRLCRQDVRRESRLLAGVDRASFDELFLDEAAELVAHDCNASGSWRGLCDLVGAEVTANEEEQPA